MKRNFFGKKHIWTSAVLGLAILPMVGAQTLSGSFQTGIGGYASSPEVLMTGPLVGTKVEGCVGSPESPAARYSLGVQGEYDPNTQTLTGSLREAWVKAYLGPVDASVGSQIVAWGATDLFTPTDVVNPRDLTLPVDRQKIPVPLGRVFLNGTGWTLDLVAVPVFRASLLPGSRWQTTASATVPTGVTVTEKTITTENPSLSWDNAAWGGRFQASLEAFQGVDIGLTVYRGRSSLPTATTRVSSTGTPGQVKVSVTRTYDRFILAGADAVAAFDSGIVLRAEAAYRVWRDADLGSPGIGDATGEAVASAEYTLPWASIKTTGEWVADWTKGSGWTDGAVAHTLIAAASATLDSRWSWKAMTGWALDGGFLFSPQVTLALADGLNLGVRGFGFFGDRTTTWGSYQDNDLAEASITYAF